MSDKEILAVYRFGKQWIANLSSKALAAFDSMTEDQQVDLLLAALFRQRAQDVRFSQRSARTVQAA